MSEVLEAMALAYDVEVWGDEKGGPCPIGLRGMRAVLDAAENLGWKMVPVDATHRMQDKGAAVSFMCAGLRVHTPTAWMAEQYRAMLAAAPSIEDGK